jgi:hypothetical protein
VGATIEIKSFFDIYPKMWRKSSIGNLGGSRVIVVINLYLHPIQKLVSIYRIKVHFIPSSSENKLYVANCRNKLNRDDISCEFLQYELQPVLYAGGRIVGFRRGTIDAMLPSL